MTSEKDGPGLDGGLEMSARRIARFELVEDATISAAVGAGGGGTAAWQLGWGQTVYKGSGSCQPHSPTQRRDIPISALRRSLSCSHLSRDSFPTTLSTNSGVTSPPSSSDSLEPSAGGGGF